MIYVIAISHNDAIHKIVSGQFTFVLKTALEWKQQSGIPGITVWSITIEKGEKQAAPLEDGPL